MSNSEKISNSEGMSNSDVRIINVDHQIIHLCIRNKTGSKSVTGIQTLDNLYSMKEVDSQHTPLVKVDFSPVDS